MGSKNYAGCKKDCRKKIAIFFKFFLKRSGEKLAAFLKFFFRKIRLTTHDYFRPPGSSERPLNTPDKVRVQGLFATQLAVLRHFPGSGERKCNPGNLRAVIRAHCIVFCRIRYFSGAPKKGAG
jgi:hypothetical protein